MKILKKIAEQIQNRNRSKTDKDPSPVSKEDYDDIINFILMTSKKVFKEDMSEVKKHTDIEHMGYFSICFRYVPLQYYITFENDRNLFVIEIFDSEGGRNSLYRICEHENSLCRKNIENAITKLHDILLENDFNFYVSKEDKLYLKKGETYKRIKHIDELQKIIEKEQTNHRKN